MAALKAHTNPPFFMHFTKTLAASYPWKIQRIKCNYQNQRKNKKYRLTPSLLHLLPNEIWLRFKQQHAANFFFFYLCHPSPRWNCPVGAQELPRALCRNWVKPRAGANSPLGSWQFPAPSQMKGVF